MLLASDGFGIRLKPQMDKGKFILRPDFFTRAIRTSKRAKWRKMQRWRFLVIGDVAIKETVRAY
jgi:hypothetical protein